MTMRVSNFLLVGLMTCLYLYVMLRHYYHLPSMLLGTENGNYLDEYNYDSKTAPGSTTSHPLHSSSSMSRSRRQQLDDILSKYDLTAAQLDMSYPRLRVPDETRSLAFLHIGKTGGSTISMHLRRGCRSSNPNPCRYRVDGWLDDETSTSRRIGSYYHMEDIPTDALSSLTTIVTSIRNPLRRFASAFACHHPANVQLTGDGTPVDVETIQRFSCFPNLVYLIKAGMGRAEIPWNMEYMRKGRPARGKGLAHYTRKGTANDVRYNCTKLAYEAFGRINSTSSPTPSSVVDTDGDNTPWLTHMSFGYGRYYQSMPPDKELIVLRNEHLWDDWAEVDGLLGGGDARGTSLHPFLTIERNVSGNYRNKERWWVQTHQEMVWLCTLLRDEIRHYIMILSRAINLDMDDLWEAMVDVDGVCTGGARGDDATRS
jgi:hypothetical protein